MEVIFALSLGTKQNKYRVGRNIADRIFALLQQKDAKLGHVPLTVSKTSLDAETRIFQGF